MRVVIPPTGNETISMLKNSSLVFVTGGVNDLLNSVVLIYSVTFQQIPLLIVASIWYLVVATNRALDRPVLPRAPLRPGNDARAGPDFVPADSSRDWRPPCGYPLGEATGDEPQEVRGEHRG